MQTANVMIALGGDMNNTVPRYQVTAAEIAVLQAIHGHEAVFDIQPAGAIEINNRAERERLRLIYGNAKNGDDTPIFDILFPGAAARVFENLDELDLVPEQFAASARVSVPTAGPVSEAEDVPVEAAPKTKAKKNTKKEPEVSYDEEPDEVPADEDSVLD